MRAMIVALLISNSIGALVAVPAFGLAIGAGKLYVMSRYRELELQGLRSPEFQMELDGVAVTDDWAIVPDFLSLDAFSYTASLSYCVAGLFLLNCVVLLVMFRRQGRS